VIYDEDGLTPFVETVTGSALLLSFRSWQLEPLFKQMEAFFECEDCTAQSPDSGALTKDDIAIFRFRKLA